MFLSDLGSSMSEKKHISVLYSWFWWADTISWNYSKLFSAVVLSRIDISWQQIWWTNIIITSRNNKIIKNTSKFQFSDKDFFVRTIYQSKQCGQVPRRLKNNLESTGAPSIKSSCHQSSAVSALVEFYPPVNHNASRKQMMEKRKHLPPTLDCRPNHFKTFCNLRWEIWDQPPVYAHGTRWSPPPDPLR